jgi:hypothetical protein
MVARVHGVGHTTLVSPDPRHLTNELLTQLGRVVERDSNTAFCGPGDLYTALAEDERYWGWFARLKGGWQSRALAKTQ